MGIGAKAHSACGQMTVEAAVAFPVLVVVAVIAVNAGLFLSECASFDRLARQAVRVHATSPAYGESAGSACGAVQQELSAAFDEPYLSVSVSHGSAGLDLDRYTAVLEFSPTLFGRGLRQEVFGVPLPRLRHQVVYVVDTYKPGVFV